MARKRKILKDFSNNEYTDTELDDFAQSVIEKMTTNPDFPTPSPTIVALTTAKTEYATALANADGGGELETAIKNTKREALEALLLQEASYVELASGGDDDKILSTGFKLSKEPEPKGPLPKPENLRVKSNEKGQLSARVQSVKGAKMYEWNIKKVEGSEPAVVETTTKANIVLNDLQSGEEYAVKVIALGTDKTRTWSDEIKSYVL